MSVLLQMRWLTVCTMTGCEIGILYADGGMTLGEKACIHIPWECGYGEK